MLGEYGTPGVGVGDLGHSHQGVQQECQEERTTFDEQTS